MCWDQIISATSAIATIAAVGFAASAAWQAKKALDVQNIWNLSSMYGDPEMYTSLKSLRTWADSHAYDYDAMARDFLSNIEMNQHRRRCTDFFKRIELMIKTGACDRGFIKKIIAPGQVEFLLELLEPLEKANNRDYDQDVFKLFAEMYSKERPALNLTFETS